MMDDNGQDITREDVENWRHLLGDHSRDEIIESIATLSFLCESHRNDSLLWRVVAERVYINLGGTPEDWSNAQIQAKQALERMWQDAHEWAKQEVDNLEKDKGNDTI